MKPTILLLLSCSFIFAQDVRNVQRQAAFAETQAIADQPSRLSPAELLALEEIRRRNPNKPGLIQYLERNPRRIEYYQNK